MDRSAGRTTVGELLKRYQSTLKNQKKSTVEKQGYLVQEFRRSWPEGLTQAVCEAKPSEVLEWLVFCPS